MIYLIEKKEEMTMNINNNQIDHKKLNYRQGAVGIVIDNNGDFLVVQMIAYNENEWRFPGGGVHEGEGPKEALLRELKEELGTDKFEVIAVSKYRNQYEWPEEVILRKLKEKGRTWRGQQQWHFLVKFTGKKEDIKIREDELRQIKWVKKEMLPSLFVFPYQWEFVEKVLEELLSQNSL